MIAVLLVLVVFLVILWAKVYQNSRRFGILENRINLFEKKMAELAHTVQELRRGSKPLEEPVLSQPSESTKPAAVEPSVPAIVPSSAEPTTPKIPATPPPVPPRPTSPPPVVSRPATPSMTAARSDVSAPIAPLTSPKPEFQSPLPIPSAWKLPKFDWESLVGVKLFSWIAGVALLLAVVFFLRYSINQGWLMPKVRMTIGILVGIGLLTLCELKAARRYPVTANAMDASAIAILFSTFYAARALWDLIGAFPAFCLMVLVTAIAVLLSIRRDSAFIALLGLLGGFATPALLSTGENQPIPLFAYLLLLNAGLAWVATQKKWPLLTTLSLIFTVFYQWGWVAKFLTESQLPVALGIFLVFPILAFTVSALGHKEESNKGWISLYGQTANITALLPLLFTLYLAAVPAYGQRYALLFSFLFLLDAGLFAIAMARGPEILHLVGSLSTLLIPAIWLWKCYTSNAWPAVLIFIVLFVFFHLFAPLIAGHFKGGFKEAGRWGVYAAPLLLFVFPSLIAMEPACANPGPLFGVLLVLVLGISGYAILAETGPVYFIASLFALLAEALWAYQYLTPDRLLSGLAVFGVFGLLYIGVPLMARKWNKGLKPELAGAGLLLLSILLLVFLAAGSVAPVAIWGLALLLLILNIGMLWQREPLLAVAGIVVSWIILGLLWTSISLDTLLVPALLVVAGFALFSFAGNIWMQKRTPEGALPDAGIFLGLAGHLFLAVVAAQQTLAVPPWPFLCVLLVLDLAIGFSALYLRRNDLHRAAMVGSALLLMIWVVTAKVAPWPSVAILSAGLLALISLIWIYLAKRFQNDSSPFSRTAAVTVILVQIVSIYAAAQPGAPGVGFLLAAHLIFLMALLGLAWFGKTYEYAVIAVFPVAIAVSFWLDRHSGPEFWPQQLLFAIPMYLVFVAYPLLLGHRCRQAIEPYLAAALASIPFFFQARHAMLQAGWENVIGILPVVQAALMGLLLLRLLGIEPRGARSLGRLALIAGAALAFVTVAIPLQLEKEWITIGWALEGMALAWLYGKIPHKGLLFASGSLFTAVFVRLALNPSVLIYAERSDIRIWNWYLYAYLVSALAMIVGGRLLAKTDDRLVEGSFRLSKVIPGGAVVLLFLLLNIEIADFYSTGPTITFKFSATLAQDLTYTLGWALFAVALLAVGIMIRNQPARIASLGLLVATSIKCFIHDLARLGELYRVMSFVGLGVCLALVALALQKFVFAARKEGK
jgi:uncharacterized membrane protein